MKSSDWSVCSDGPARDGRDAAAKDPRPLSFGEGLRIVQAGRTPIVARSPLSQGGLCWGKLGAGGGTLSVPASRGRLRRKLAFTKSQIWMLA